MQRPPNLTDQTALTRARARAQARPDAARFLQDVVADEIEERLSAVNRAFTAPAVVTGWPEVWQERIPGARIVADEEVLALESGAHDLVIHALALHWANDPVGQLIQARRALQPDGFFLGACFGGQTLAELRAALATAEAEVTGGLSPRVLPMADIRDLGALLQRAGLALPVADGFSRQVSYRDIWHLMRDLRAMGESNAMAERSRRPTRRSVFEAAEQHYRRGFGSPDGRLPATFDIICLTGWAPDDSQPQPLRPGSAKARLADALGATETPLPRDPGAGHD